MSRSILKRNTYGIQVKNEINANFTELYSQVEYTFNYGDDGDAIQDAIDALSGGGVVVIDGNDNAPYLVSSVIIVPSNVTVIIQEDVKLADSLQINIFQTADYNTNGPSTNNVHFIGQGGTLDGNKANQTAGTSGLWQNAIGIQGTNCTVKDISVKDTFYHGVFVSGGSYDVHIKDSYFKDCGASGVSFHFNESHSLLFERAIITGNRFDRCGNFSIGAVIWMSGGTQILVSNNTLENTGIGDGIVIYNGDTALGMDDFQVTNNIIKGPTRNGIKIWTANSEGEALYNGLVSGNAIRNCGSHGIFIEAGTEQINDIIISGNDIYNVSQDGMRIDETVINMTITGNIVNTAAGQGIYLRSVNIKDYMISDNIMKSCGSYGMILQGDGIFVGNYCIGNGNGGLNVAGNNNTISGNVCKNNNQRGTGSNGEISGIWIQGTDNSVIGNRCLDDQGTKTQGWGIYHAGDYNAYIGNTLRGNDTADFGGSMGANSIKANNL